VTLEAVEVEAQEPKKGFFAGLIQGINERISSPGAQKQVMWALGSILMAMVIATVMMVIAGYDAFLAWIALIRGMIVRWDRTLLEATPLIFTGLSVGLAFKCGLFNIGPEGQLYVGSMVAAIVGYMVALPIIVHPLVCILLAAGAGFLYGFLPGLLKAYRGAHEVVTTMMLSYIAINLTSWLVRGPFKEPNQMVDQTPDLLQSAWLPSIYREATWGIVIAVAIVILVDIFINKTVIGFEMRAVGLNKDAAEYSGINAKRNMALALGIAGALAGMGGAVEIQSNLHRFEANWSKGYGWDGITVAVLGNNSPWGIFLGALLFGALRTGGREMQRLGFAPEEIISVVQGLVVLFIAAPRIIEYLSKTFTEEGGRAAKNTHEAAPFFFGLSVALAGTILGIASVTLVLDNPTILWMILLGAIVGVYAFMKFLIRERAAIGASFVQALIWFVVATLGYTMAPMSIVILFAVLGVLSVITGILVRRYMPERELQGEGGEM
jgi:ABC-type uncharacterized transport system permease subunit